MEGVVMGAWGVLAFDNDQACDWAGELIESDDLSPVEDAFDEVEENGAEYLDSDLACNALAACEVLARLQGRPGYTNAYTEDVDKWVAAHPHKPTPKLLKRAGKVMDRILGEDSEWLDLWSETGDDDWCAAFDDLRKRTLG
ncbi:MAG: DUF4259 domain-containing protein [Pirellulales bacterium]